MKLEDLPELDWEKGAGLLPAVVQHARTGELLMLAYMNRAALRSTLADGRATFYSRSRNELWTKGASSGNYLEVVAVSADCDRDAILVQAVPAGPVCHTGLPTCFPQAAKCDVESLAFLIRLEKVIADRIARRPDGSYTARLSAEGPRRIAQKVAEEGFELALAAATGDDAEVRAEAADLLYHLTLLLTERGLPLAAVIEELERRHADRTTPRSTAV
jgi:phosphoribosyl-ATP pyrophosphohydrolase/phosphoribosyl-AMP cyclohydrolase